MPRPGITKPFFILASLLALGVLAASALPALAQQIDVDKPIPIKKVKVKSTLEKFLGEVLHATPAAITVRSQENERVIRTFTYSDQVKEQMQRIIEAGGYQYGDRVEIFCEPGTSVAQRIKGKPSKPL